MDEAARTDGHRELTGYDADVGTGINNDVSRPNEVEDFDRHPDGRLTCKPSRLLLLAQVGPSDVASEISKADIGRAWVPVDPCAKPTAASRQVPGQPAKRLSNVHA